MDAIYFFSGGSSVVVFFRPCVQQLFHLSYRRFEVMVLH